MICADRTCDCGIVSDSLTITGSGQQGDPYHLETNAYSIVTSVTRPGSPFTNQFIWETDSQRQRVWTGADWLIVGGAMPAWNLTRVASDTAQTIADNTGTDVVYANEVEDSDGFHTGTTAVVTIPVGYGGDYLVSVGQSWSGNAATYRLSQITIASNTSSSTEMAAIRGFSSAATDSATASMFTQTSKRVRVEAGATLTSTVLQTSGGDLTLSFGWFTGTMMRHRPTLT